MARNACVHAQLCPAVCDPTDYSLPGSFHPWDIPGKNARVGCHFPLQGILILMNVSYTFEKTMCSVISMRARYYICQLGQVD